MSGVALILASASPRRRSLLRGAGFDPSIVESDIDDAKLRRGAATPEAFVTALSWFKAARVIDRHRPTGAVVLAADTECLDGDRLLGKPRDETHARAMLQGFRGRSHRVITGVTAIGVDGTRHLFVDAAHVFLGDVSDSALDEYVASGAWRGKSGGYNYSERLAAGWPLECEGDPTSVMGLPMLRTVPLLERLGVQRDARGVQRDARGVQRDATSRERTDR